MKIAPNMIFGGVSALAGLAALYYTRMKALQPNQINVLPALASSPSYAPGQPTANGASIPAFYASPFQLPPDVTAASTGQPQQVPYQVVNFGPSHVASKQTAQAAVQTSAPPAPSSDGCGCGTGASKKRCNNYGTRTNVSAETVAAQAKNFNGVGTSPLGYLAKPTPSIYGPATSFDLATMLTVPAVNRMNNQGQTLVGNVPSISDYQ